MCHHLYSCCNGYFWGTNPIFTFLVGENVRGRHICQVSNWWIRKTSRVLNLSTGCLPKVMRIVFPRPKLSWRFLARSAKGSDTATTKLTTEKVVVGRPTQKYRDKVDPCNRQTKRTVWILAKWLTKLSETWSTRTNSYSKFPCSNRCQSIANSLGLVDGVDGKLQQHQHHDLCGTDPAWVN